MPAKLLQGRKKTVCKHYTKHWESVGGMRVYREQHGNKVYRYLCPDCGHMGEVVRGKEEVN